MPEQGQIYARFQKAQVGRGCALFLGSWWHWGITRSLLAAVTCSGHQQSLGPRKSSQLLRVSWFAKLLLFKHQPNYGSGSPVFLEGPPHPWNLAAPKSICCALPANAEVVLACFTLRSKVSIRVVEKTKVPPHVLLLILFSIFNCFHKMLPVFGSCCWGSSSNASGFAQAQGRRVQDMAIRLMKAFKFGWIKIVSLGFSQNKSTGRVGEGGLRQTAVWRTEGHT